jgi:hypothetical protein
MRNTIVAAVLGAVLGAGVTLAAVPHAPGPRACSGPSLPSGDAMSVGRDGNAVSPPSGGVAEFVCTDGTWVRVDGYGN